ncbi:MAG: PilZ domain-containing protein [Phycisphaerales bacterium]|nr:PilZ domain-containing protein [Phycisphaerales bacterium]
MLPHAASTASYSPSQHGEPRHELRRETRVPFRVPCRVHLVEPKSGYVRTVLGETLNISRRGISLQLSVNPPVGTWVETLVPHAHGDPVFVCGTVVHSRRTLAHGFEIGVRTAQAPAFQ